MYGKNVGELNIYFDNITLVPGLKLKNITGEQGFQWFQLQTDISSQSEFRIAIEAVVIIFYIYLVKSIFIFGSFFKVHLRHYLFEINLVSINL